MYLVCHFLRFNVAEHFVSPNPRKGSLNPALLFDLLILLFFFFSAGKLFGAHGAGHTGQGTQGRGRGWGYGGFERRVLGCFKAYPVS